MTSSLDKLWAPWRRAYIETAAEPSDGNGCFLCAALQDGDDRKRLVVDRLEQTFVIMNLYPYNNGHLLVAPNRHVGGLEQLDEAEMCRLFQHTREAVSWLQRAYNPHGFNIGLNLGRVAGAGLPGHLHLHIVPRWDGDTNFMPVLSETKVISEALDAGWAKLREARDQLHAHVGSR